MARLTSTVSLRMLVTTCLSLAHLAHSCPSFPGYTHHHTSLTTCLTSSSVPIASSTASNYSVLISPFNLRVPYQPLVVVLPETPQHVSSALLCARQYNVKVAARGGGHSYGSMGLGGKDGSMVVDMQKFNKIEVNQSTWMAKVGAGVRLGNLARGMYAQGKRAVPHGTCPGVGVAGHALHGGFGFASRMWGLTLDVLLKMDVVLANGTITIASPTVNSDLFWALRGAGSSFAVVTTFHLETIPAPETGIAFTIDLPESATSTTEQKVTTFLAIQDFGLNDTPKEMALRWFMSKKVWSIQGVYWGARPEFDAATALLTRRLPAGTGVTAKEMGWMDMLASLANGQAIEQPLTGYDVHETFFAKSLVTSQSDPLTSSVLTPFFDYLSDQGLSAPTSWWIFVELYGGRHSLIQSPSHPQLPAFTSCYSHRDALWTFQFHSYTPNQKPPYPRAGFAFVDNMLKSLTDMMDPSTLKAYPNYLDPTLTKQEAWRQYYGAEILARLEKIKKVYDPEILIWNPFVIGG